MIRRNHLNIICCHIRPENQGRTEGGALRPLLRVSRYTPAENVISLTLSDDNDTSSQSKLFRSHFQIKQFSHLWSLTLVKIEFQALEGFFSIFLYYTVPTTIFSCPVGIRTSICLESNELFYFYKGAHRL